MAISNAFNNQVVLCLGDSISDYTYFSKNMYPGTLARFLPGSRVISCGIAGNATTDILNNRLSLAQPEGVKTYNPFLGPTDPNATYSIGQICFVLIGINDLLFLQPSATTLWVNMSFIYSIVRNVYGMQVIPMTILPYGNASPNNVSILSNTATSGTFTMSYGTHVTGNIAWNASAATVASALSAIQGVGTVTGTGGPLPGQVSLAFATSPTSAITVDDTNIVGANLSLDVGWNAYGESVRSTVNDNIRNTYSPYVELDGLGDNSNQPALLSQYDNGDGVHPSARGSQQIAVCAASCFEFPQPYIPPPFVPPPPPPTDPLPAVPLTLNTLPKAVTITKGTYYAPLVGFTTAFDLFHSLGVNTHFASNTNTTYAGGISRGIVLLQSLGIKHIRDAPIGAPNTRYQGSSWPVYNAMAAAGIGVIMATDGCWGTQYTNFPTGQLANQNITDHSSDQHIYTWTDLISAVHTYNGGSTSGINVAALDGFLTTNEPDGFQGSYPVDSNFQPYSGIIGPSSNTTGDYWQPVRMWIRDMWQTVKADSAVKHLPVIGPATGSAGYRLLADSTAAWNKMQNWNGGSHWVAAAANYEWLNNGGTDGIGDYLDFFDVHTYTDGVGTTQESLVKNHGSQPPVPVGNIAGARIPMPGGVNGNAPGFGTEVGWTMAPRTCNGNPANPDSTGHQYTNFTQLKNGGWPFGIIPGANAANPVSDVAAAEYILRVYLIQYLFGLRRTYIYELFCSFDDSIWGGPPIRNYQSFYGLWHFNGAERSILTGAIRNFISLLDKNARPSTTKINAPTIGGYTIGNSPTAASDDGYVGLDRLFALSVQRVDGKYIIFLWRTGGLWDQINFTTAAPAVQNITVTMPGMTTASWCKIAQTTTQTPLTVTSNSVIIPMGGETVAITVG